MDLGLTGRRALVTGATRGIGRAIVSALAAEGCSLGICARDAGAVRATVGELGALGVPVVGHDADVTAPGELEAWVSGCADALGGVDVVVACAGGAVGPRGVTASSAADWLATYELNAVHALRLVAAAAPWLERASDPGGSAVLISSISGRVPGSNLQYGMAKAAMDHAAAQLARDLAPQRIRVNAVAPGSILFDGGGWAGMRERDPERFGRFVAEELPAGRLGTPEEVARVVAFLCSPAASWVNGSVVAVDGAQGLPGARP